MSLRVGDTVVRASAGVTLAGGDRTKLDAETKGRICRVVAPGLSYKVRYEGLDFCVLQFRGSIVKVSARGPACPSHSTC